MLKVGIHPWILAAPAQCFHPSERPPFPAVFGKILSSNSRCRSLARRKIGRPFTDAQRVLHPADFLRRFRHFLHIPPCVIQTNGVEYSYERPCAETGRRHSGAPLCRRDFPKVFPSLHGGSPLWNRFIPRAASCRQPGRRARILIVPAEWVGAGAMVEINC